MFVRNDLVERKIKSCRKSSKRFLEFKKKLGLDPNVVTCDEQDIINTLQVVFEGEIIFTQYCIENKRLDAYFSNHKLGIEVDEYNHEGRNSNYEKSRQLMIESHGITIIRTNPDSADFDINRLINQIYMHIIESTKKQTKVSTKKSLIDDLSKELVELELKSNHAIKMGCQKCFTKLQKMKKTQSEIKPIKIGKRPGKMFCFGCKNFTHNFRLKKVNMTNKVLREKSHCVIC